MFSKKATKIDEIFTVDLTLCKGGFKSEGRGGFSQLPKMSAEKTILGLKKGKC